MDIICDENFITLIALQVIRTSTYKYLTLIRNWHYSSTLYLLSVGGGEGK